MKVVKKKKDEIVSMEFQIVRNCLNEFFYLIISSMVSIVTKNDTKMTHKIWQGFKLVLFGK